MKLEAFGKSEKGIHLENQDSFLIDIKAGVFAVADGVTVSKGDSRKASQAAVAFFKGFSGSLEDAFFSVNKKILELEGAGTTTLTVAQIKEGNAVVGHVGDSSLFLARDSVKEITEKDLVEGSNLLTQSIGTKQVRPHLYKIPLKEGDVLLMATDGVAKHLTEREILDTLKPSLEKYPAKLIAIAKEKRKLYEDDKTVIIVGIG